MEALGGGGAECFGEPQEKSNRKFLVNLKHLEQAPRSDIGGTVANSARSIHRVR